MQDILTFITTQPPYVYIAAGGVVLVVLLIVLLILVGRARFARRVQAFIDIPGTKNRADYFADDELLRRTRQIEQLTSRHGEELVTALGLDRLWIQRLSSQARRADFNRVLAYAPETGLFTCFIVALNNVGLRSTLSGYLAEHSDFLVLRRLAAGGRGEQFSGRAARDFFQDRIDEIREMTGDPEWPSRYFALKVLLHDDDDRSVRALWDGFSDPHPLVRRTLCLEFESDERERFYEQLESLFRNDPVYEVREAARNRIRSDFADLYTFDPATLTPEEAIHTVDLLDPDSPDDQNTAIQLLSGENEELRLAAARFLTRCGALERLFLEADLGDREALERSLALLSNAAQVSVTGFLGALKRNPSPGSLFIASRLLQEHGTPDLLVETAERVFRLQAEVTPNYLELYQQTVDALSARGSDDGLRLLEREVVRRRENDQLFRTALSGVPEGKDHVFASTLMEAFRDPETPERDALRTAVARLARGTIVAETMSILTGGRQRYPHLVRMEALKLLGDLRLPYALQDILEHLPILPRDEAREFAAKLSEYHNDELERKVAGLLAGVDGSIRSAVIAALPATGKRTFLSEIKQALGDADPDVRISATWALVDYKESRSLAQAAEMLRDPVPRVRVEVARALGTAGSQAALDSLRTTVEDGNEIQVVKSAAIVGLGASKEPVAVDILVAVLDADEEMRDEVLFALASKTDARSIARLVEQFKDAAAELRDLITQAFKMMGESGEQAIRAVLDEDIASLKPFLADILDQTGFVESRIRMLNHRDPRIRRDAAVFLSKVGSKAAFRGIVLAARDPDNEVRVQVTKALERLASDEGSEILRELESDPDRRIRKYTHWALQRIEAKSL